MGLTRIKAEQISDIDYKQAVRVITLSNITLSGGAPNTVDGVTLVANDRVLVAGQNTGSQNGLYYVSTLGTGSNGTWTRTTDGNETGEIEAGMIVMVTEGDTYKDSQWKLTTNNPIVIGTTTLTFEQNSAYAFGNIVANGTAVLADTVGDTLTLTPGNNFIITGNATTDTITFAVTQSPNFTGTFAVSGTVGSNLIPTSNITYNLGNTTNRWNDIWLSNSTIYLGNAQISANTTTLILTNPQGGQFLLSGTSADLGLVTLSASGNITGGNLRTAGLITATGNVTGGNLLTGGLISATSTITSAANITGGNLLTGGLISATSTVTSAANVIGGNLSTAGLITATGNVTGGNILTGGLISATSTITSAANITGGNINTAGLVTATGNISGGNLRTVGLITATGNIDSGNVRTAGVVTATGNVTGGNILTAGIMSSTGNAIHGNILTGGLISATSTITSAANITGGNLITSGLVSATGSVVGITLKTTNSSGDEGGQVDFALPVTNSTLSSGVAIDVWQNRVRIFETGGNNRGGFFDISACNASVGTNFAAGGGGGGTPGGSDTQVQFNDSSAFAGSAAFTFQKLTNTVSVGGVVSVSGNVTGGNLLTGGLISATSTITSAANVVGGNITTAGLITATGNVIGGNVRTAGVVTATGNVTGGNLLTGGLISATSTITSAANVVGGNITTAGLVTATGNITGGNILTAGIVSATGNITGNVFIGNGSQLTGTINFTSVANTPPASPKNGDFWYDTFTDKKYQYFNDGDSSQWVDQSFPTVYTTLTTGQIVNGGATTTGNIGAAGGYFGNLFVSKIFTSSIENSGSNGVGNIGTSSTYFNTVFAKATSAQYADLAEIYASDRDYPPGTVVVFGGEKEITISINDYDTRIAGVISDKPAFLMNATGIGLPVAFTGRVQCQVRGPVDKGSVLVSSNDPGVARAIGPQYEPGCVIGKSLQTIEDDSIKMIEIVVGRF